ncbi:MAG: ATP-binding protein [Caldilineaceae bacterium]
MRFHRLRTKLAIANVLPILLLAPLLSLYLLYSLEGLFTQKLEQRLTQQAHLILSQLMGQPAVLQDAPTAQRFLHELAQNTDAHVLLLDQQGRILGSTRAEYTERIGDRYNGSGLTTVLQGTPVQGTGPGIISEVAYVMLPVQEAGSLRGVLRLSYEVDDVRALFRQLRWLVLGGVGGMALAGLGLGLGLAITITAPLHQMMQRIQAIAAGHYQTRLTLQRQDEIGMVAQHFNQMAAQLEESAVTRQRQLAAIAHELARPLTGMRAAVETLLDGADEDATIRPLLLSGIGEELARLERLVGTLHSLDKRQLQPLQLQCGPVSLARLIQGSVAHFEARAAQLDVTLTMQLPATLPSLIADEDRLIQVLTNLLDNALKFTPRGGQITVTAGASEHSVWVQVCDTGVGIAPEELPFLFQQFYRGAASRPPEKQGMGLGLTLCREIITAHGGEITVSNPLGQGACFTFTLPLSSETH